jgi:hypothetical protein
LTLRYFGQFDVIMEERFKVMEAERKKWRVVAFGQAKGSMEKQLLAGPAGDIRGTVKRG